MYIIRMSCFDFNPSRKKSIAEWYMDEGSCNDLLYGIYDTIEEAREKFEGCNPDTRTYGYSIGSAIVYALYEAEWLFDDEFYAKCGNKRCECEIEYKNCLMVKAEELEEYVLWALKAQDCYDRIKVFSGCDRWIGQILIQATKFDETATFECADNTKELIEAISKAFEFAYARGFKIERRLM